ncbi:sensor histidine kinase [Spirillospora sp. NBC_01491]|uniref:sensor histidine kinase n=1 Tax=Spirillospora sp. NBC_01491 TaxID=2976007 RepID=UPI002E350D0D|nr:histidine kinase [Spirillospora sp. NBC_01491]
MNDSAPPVRSPRRTAPAALRDAVRRPTRRAARLDALLWAALAFPPVTGDMIPPRPDDPRWWAQAAGLALLTAAVALCRAAPLPALLTVFAIIPAHGNFAFALPVMSYLVGRRTVRSRPVLWAFTAVFVAGAMLNLVRGTDVTLWFPLTIWLVLLGVLPWLAGHYWRQYQELVHAGWERAEHLEREQQIIAERERLRERARIAQDMHDSLGHELVLIAVRAGALQVAPGLDERHRTAAAELRAGAADATDQLRKIIGVLQPDSDGTAATDTAATDPGEDPTPPGTGTGTAPIRPAHESITDLIARARASGIPVRLTGDDAPARLAPMARLAAHRIVQEAITNAVKHAPGAAVTVRLTHDAHGTLTLTVVNDAPPQRPDETGEPGSRGGRGLTGLTERARLAGGTLTTGPTPSGGFHVTAELPPAGDTPTGPPAPGHHHPATTPDETTTPESESALRLARERRQVRRSLITAITVPAALITVLGTVMAAYYIVVTPISALSPDRYTALRIGAPRADVERSTPRMELMNAGTVRARNPEPQGADCRYYRSDANLLGSGAVYRLCFVQGRLAAKDVLHPATDPDDR